MDEITEIVSGLTRNSVPIRGGNRNNAGDAGLAALNLNNVRSNSNSNIGFRLALLHRLKPAGHGLPDGAGRKGGQFHLCRSRGMENINSSGRQVGDCPTRPGLSFGAKKMPKTYNNLWGQIVNWENVYSAYLEAVKGKRYNASALRVRQVLEENITNTLNHLIWETWEPAPFRSFYVYEPKKRLIHAPALRDRIVHHALVRQIEPLFEKKFIYDSYACRRGKGIQRAAARLQEFLRRAHRNWDRVYVLQADIASYFPSILHGRLLRQIAKKIKDSGVMRLWTLLLRALNRPKGLPIGALTSQLGANIYLDALDHFIKDELGEKYYVRYMDDWLLFSPSKSHLWARLELIKEFLADDMGLFLNPKTRIFPAKQGVDFTGYRVWKTHILPRKRNIVAARRRIKKLASLYIDEKISRETLQGSVASFLGYSKHCSANFAVENILSEVPVG